MSPTSNRDRALAAALELVGERGLTALTHRRVDRRAGLPEGSTSNHFRTRRALIQGLVERLETVDTGDVAPSLPSNVDQLVEGLASAVEVLTGPRRTHTAARLHLFVEGAHDDDVRESLGRSRANMHRLTEAMLAAAGAEHPADGAQTVMAVCEGLILHRIANQDHADPRPAIRVAVRGAMGAAAS